MKGNKLQYLCIKHILKSMKDILIVNYLHNIQFGNQKHMYYQIYIHQRKISNWNLINYKFSKDISKVDKYLKNQDSIL
jgi:hypothetical protein